eukprot:COSAG03_NODE_368_length_8526_cov_6.102053_1_plen_45_part_10
MILLGIAAALPSFTPLPCLVTGSLFSLFSLSLSLSLSLSVSLSLS